VHAADIVRAGEVAAEQLQERAQPPAPPGASGTRIVSSETLPSRLPARPALSIGGGGAVAASDCNRSITFSSATLPTSGASANSSRNWAILASTSE
jgi:hypothetical protein